MKEGVSSTLNENVADGISPKTGLSWRLSREKLKGSILPDCRGWSMLGFGMGWLKEIDPSVFPLRIPERDACSRSRSVAC